MAPITMSSAADDNGNKHWSIEVPEHVIDVGGLLEAKKDLVDEIAFGIGVPPEDEIHAGASIKFA